VQTIQRVLDVITVCRHFHWGQWSVDWPVLALTLVITTVLMAFTMTKHWSARLNHMPHGKYIGGLTAVLQIAPVWEMCDKLLFASLPRGTPGSSDAAGVSKGGRSHLGGRSRSFGIAAAIGTPREPLLPKAADAWASPSVAAPMELGQDAPPQSMPPKGSQGENQMRGIRKLSMVNLPQAMASLWCHIYDLMPVYPPTDAYSVANEPRNRYFLTCAFVCAVLCVAFGVADFVLYIWVDDAFVKLNKKLVTLHYTVEILSRVPTVVLFHVTYSRLYHYRPTFVLLACDVLTTSVLLLIPRFYQGRRCCCVLDLCTRQTATQFVYSLLVSAPLFFVNIVFFDPGMSFFYVNQVFYVVKYCELMFMWWAVDSVRKKFFENNGILYGLPRDAYRAFWWTNVLFTACNIVLVFVVVPWKQGTKIQHLMSGIFANAPSRKVTPSELVGVGSSTPPTSPFPAAATSPGPIPAINTTMGGNSWSLERLEEIFEMLWLLSKATQRRNRARVLETTVHDLWLQALCWEGAYSVGEGDATAYLTIDPSRLALVMKRLGPGAPRESICSIVANTVIAPSPSTGTCRGVFDGNRIYWDDGTVWTRQCDDATQRCSMANAALKLILPQLALALRWDSPAAGSSASSAVARGDSRRSRGVAAEGGVMGDIEEGRALKTCVGRPLLDFLVRYSLITQQSDFLSELYWTLYCLSDKEAARDSGPEVCDGYAQARHTLLESLQDGAVAGWPPAMLEKVEPFLRSTRRLLQNQREIWRQNMELLTKHSGRTSGGGAWTVRTQMLRRALRNWTEHRQRASSSRVSDVDEELLQPVAGGGEECNSPMRWQLMPPTLSSGSIGTGRAPIDLVAPVEEEEGGRVSLPIDPATQFRGVVIEESEVIPSKQAPLMLTCRTRRSRDHEVESSRSSGILPGVSTSSAVEVEGRERYLLKFGDDLRQDQLMLQLMSLMAFAWREKLGAADAALLHLAMFKVLAVTPNSGYVKCVPDAVQLSMALHQSRGSLDAWLERNRPADLSFDEVFDNFCGSVAASCVVTYVLGIGDRHLENIMITPRGFFFHIDFSFVLGDDPKPIAPPVRLPQQVAQALRRTQRLAPCFRLAGEAYIALRPFAGLLGSLLRLMAEAGGSGCTKLAKAPSAKAAIAGVHERLRVDQADHERAASEFLCLMRESSEGLASIFLDKVHAAGLFWR